MKEYRINYTGNDGKRHQFKTYNPLIAGNVLKALKKESNKIREWGIRSIYIDCYGEDRWQVSTIVGSEAKVKAFAEELRQDGRRCIRYWAKG